MTAKVLAFPERLSAAEVAADDAWIAARDEEALWARVQAQLEVQQWIERHWDDGPDDESV